MRLIAQRVGKLCGVRSCGLMKGWQKGAGNSGGSRMGSVRHRHGDVVTRGVVARKRRYTSDTTTLGKGAFRGRTRFFELNPMRFQVRKLAR